MSKNRFLNLFKLKENQEKQAMDKQFIQELQNLIGSKLKDPQMAKKAAQIIEEMIQGKADTKTKQKSPKNKKSA